LVQPLAAILALLVIGVSACRIYIIQSAEGPGPSAPTARPAPPDPKSAEIHSEIHLKLNGRARPIVLLGRAENEDGAQWRDHERGILARELVRQAFWMAALEGCDAETHDDALGEPTRPGPVDVTLRLTSVSNLAGPSEVEVRMGRSRGGKLLASKTFTATSGPPRHDPAVGGPDPVNPPIDLLELVRVAEHLARDEFPTALRQTVRTGPTPKTKAGAAVPEDAERRLGQLTLTEQFAALRLVHRAVRKEGASLRTSAALARLYANLGVLAEPHWRATHKIFKARALLYAERLVAEEPRSASAFWHRAYVRALVGLHRAALDDVAAARRLERPGLETPGWADLIEGFCRFDRRPFAGLAQRAPLAQFGRLLEFLMVEATSGANSRADDATLVIGLARAALRVNPECYRIHDALGDHGGVANLHQATTLGFELFTRAFPRRVRELPGLPASVASALEGRGGEPEVVRALVVAGAPGKDPDEPSWDVLGRLAREVRFAQVYRRIKFMRLYWQVPSGDFLEEVRPLVAAHPFRPMLDAPLVRRNGRTGFDPRTDLELRDVDATFPDLLTICQMKEDDWARKLFQRAGDQSDVVAGDVRMLARITQQERYEMDRLKEVSPHSPLLAALTIEKDWETARPQAKGWERQFAGYPAVLGALGRRYAQFAQHEDARRCLEASIALSPDPWAFEALAASHRAAGHNDLWRTTLERVLEQEDSGLDHARIRVEIAKDFMSRKEWDKAVPYAEAAAQSWASWAMECAVQCYEGQTDFRRAELWARRRAERYPAAAADWFQWCLRTGHGDVRAAARRTADSLRFARGRKLDDNTLGNLILAAVLLHEPRLALGPTLEGFPHADDKHNLEGLYLGLLADEAGDFAVRDRAWTDHKAKEEAIVGLGRLFRETVDAGSDTKGPERKALDGIIASSDPARRADLAYFAGRFLQQRGRDDDAIHYLKQVGTEPQAKLFMKRLALEALRDLGAAPTEKDSSPRERDGTA
jgi:tetratricopeptide (TPR) repeat protein